MEKNSVVLWLVLCGFMGCASLDTSLGHFQGYVELDQRTYELIGKEYEAYVLEGKENHLTPEQKNLRKKTMESWKIRIEETLKRVRKER